MKDFIREVLAVICGLFIMWIIGFILMLGFIGSLSSMSKDSVIPRKGVLDMNLSNISLVEQASSMPIDPMTLVMGGSMATEVSLYDAVSAIRTAATDPGVQYIYLRTDGAAAGIAGGEELRQALEYFRSQGKAIVSFVENPTVGSLYLASVSDKIYASSIDGSSPMLTGVGTQMLFLKDILDKFGVNVQLIRHGKYKSAGEMYIKNAPSPENLEQNQVMIDGIWKALAQGICEGREMSIERLSEIIDNLEVNNNKDLVKVGLADAILTPYELEEKLSTLAGAKSFKDVQFIPFADYVSAKAAPKGKGKAGKLAIIYADGEIAEDGNGIVGDKLAKTINKVCQDETIKAVVFRVSSPGGSVTASSKIKIAMDSLCKKKPVIASYGAYAASGGYWISNNCSKIYSDATTLTGSIGVFSMIPDLSGTLKNIAHVNSVTVGSSEHSDMFSMMRPLSEQETAFMQASVEEIYDRFVTIVSEGRDLTKEHVDSIAQGRVWTGADAIGIGLVDEIGSLYDALSFAAVAGGSAELADWKVETYPKVPSPFEQILGSSSEEIRALFTKKEILPFEQLRKAYSQWNFETSERFYARMPYEYIIQ